MPNRERIIDFHTHTFPAKTSKKIVDKLGHIGIIPPYTDGSTAGLLASMRKTGIAYSVNLPVMTNVAQVEKVNALMIEERESMYAQGLIAFGGMHPDYPDYKRELAHLKRSGIPGIKLHPAYQNVDLDDIRMLRIIDAASELGLIVLIHAGVDIGLYDHNYSSVAHILKVLKEVQPEKFVLAHMGNWACWEEVESDLAGAPVWMDTAFSLGPITPFPGLEEQAHFFYNLHREDFVRIARKHGTDRILFATDSPWGDQADYVAKIENALLTEAEQHQIFWKNAAKLLAISDS